MAFNQGPKISIPALPDIADAINEVVDWVEGLPAAKQIRAGPHILLREDVDTIVIEGTPAGEGGSVSKKCPFDVVLKAQDPPEDPPEDYVPTYDVSATAGSVNQLLASNYDEDFAVIEGDEVGYLIVHIDLDAEGGVTSVTMKLETETCDAVEVLANAVPTSVDILVGVVDNGRWERSLGCGSIVIYPHEAFHLGSDTYWTWRTSLL